MPFQSQAQKNYLFAKKPAVAKEFATMTPNTNSLPARLPSAQLAASKLKKKS